MKNKFKIILCICGIIIIAGGTSCYAYEHHEKIIEKQEAAKEKIAQIDSAKKTAALNAKIRAGEIAAEQKSSQNESVSSSSPSNLTNSSAITNSAYIGLKDTYTPNSINTASTDGYNRKAIINSVAGYQLFLDPSLNQQEVTKKSAEAVDKYISNEWIQGQRSTSTYPPIKFYTADVQYSIKPDKLEGNPIPASAIKSGEKGYFNVAISPHYS